MKPLLLLDIYFLRAILGFNAC